MSPKMGLTTSGHAIRIKFYLDLVAKKLRHLSKCLADNSLPHPMMSAIASRIGIPVRLGIRFERGEMKIYCKNRNLTLFATQPLE